MNCLLCKTRYAMAEHVPDATGLLKPMCIECAAQHGRPKQFPEGTQRTGVVVTGAPRVDFAQHEHARLLELHTAQRDSLANMLYAVLAAFPELRTSLSTATQQQVLREARALLAEVGVALP